MEVNALLFATCTPEDYVDLVFPSRTQPAVNAVLRGMLEITAPEHRCDRLLLWIETYTGEFDYEHSLLWARNLCRRRNLDKEPEYLTLLDVYYEISVEEEDAFVHALLNPANRVGRWK